MRAFETCKECETALKKHGNIITDKETKEYEIIYVTNVSVLTRDWRALFFKELFAEFRFAKDNTICGINDK